MPHTHTHESERITVDATQFYAITATAAAAIDFHKTRITTISLLDENMCVGAWCCCLWCEKKFHQSNPKKIAAADSERARLRLKDRNRANEWVRVKFFRNARLLVMLFYFLEIHRGMNACMMRSKSVRVSERERWQQSHSVGYKYLILARLFVKWVRGSVSHESAKSKHKSYCRVLVKLH